MPYPTTNTTTSADACAGEQIKGLKGFSDGCLFARVADGQTLILSGINLGASVVTVERVIEGNCDEKYYLPMQTPSGCALLITDATPMQPIKVAGYYRLCISPANPDALLGQEYVDSDGAACCSINAQCQPAVVAPPPAPITQSITPCPATFPMVWDYDGATYATLGAFAAAYKAAMLPVAVTFAAPCTFSAPAGTAFLPTALSAIVVVPPPVVYCPSQPLIDGGFGYHIADPKDPAATVEIAPCPSDTTTASIWIYDSAAAGRTVQVVDCDGAFIGYGVNQSSCAPTCPCPDMNVTVNNAAPVNNVSVAAPTVNVAPAVNNFTPTTNVAAPTVVMPPAPVTGAVIAADGSIAITSTNAAGQQTVVQSNALPSC